MDNLKLNISKLIDLQELIFYIDYVNEQISCLNSNLNNILNKYIDAIGNIDLNLKMINVKIDSLSNCRINNDNDFIIFKKINLIYIIVAVLLLLFSIYFKNILFVIISLIILVICSILSLSFLDRRYYFNYFGREYNRNLETYLELQKKLNCLYVKSGKDKGIKEKYKSKFNLDRNYKLFNIKYNFFKKYYVVFLKELEVSKSKLLAETLYIYKENNIDCKYQNYLAISGFNEYLKINNSLGLNDVYSLYEKEYGFIINEDKGTINKFSNNKLRQEFDSNKLVLIDNVLNEINVCITDNTKSLDDLIKLIIKLQGNFYNTMIKNYFYDLDESLINKYLKSSGIMDYYLEKLKDK